MPPNHDFDVPSRAFIATGGKGYSVQFGRDKLSWGPGSSSNFIIGDHHKYQDFLRFTFYNEKVKFTNVILFMHPPGYTTRFRHPYVPSSTSDYTVRMFLAHRLEFNINSWLHLEISENVMYQDTTFNFKYLNPLYIYHNYGNRSLFNAIADISLEANIARGVNVYASIAFDQLTAPTESSDQPPALAYMIGVKYYYPTKTGWWNFLVEGVYIDPYMYMRDKVDFIIMTREREQYYGAVPHYEYLGYKDGGDLIVATIKGEYHANQELSMSSSFTYKAKGNVDIETPYIFGGMPNLSAPTSPLTNWFITNVTARYVKDDVSLLIFKYFEILAEVDLIIKKEGNKSPLIDTQCIVGLTLGL